MTYGPAERQIDSLKAELVAKAARIELLEARLRLLGGLREVDDDLQDLDPWGATLTAQEARLVVTLKAAAGRVVSKDHLLAQLYQARPNEIPEIKIIDVFVCKARKKLAGSPFTIETVWGKGYRLVDSARAEASPAAGGPRSPDGASP